MTRKEMEARIAELEADNEAAGEWGAAVGARLEEINSLKRRLRSMPEEPANG